MRIIATMAAISAAATMYASAPEAPEGMELVWHDEFDTPGAPAPHWSYEEGFVRNGEDQWYTPANASVADGMLVITARNVDFPNPVYKPGSDDWRHSRQRVRYTSACLTTRHSFRFQYGRLEVRARIPVAPGSWPAIWTLGDRYRWPANGELDLMEFYRRDGQPIILANACWLGADGRDAWDSAVTPFAHFTDADPLWASKFHVWTMDWTPDTIRMSLDGELLNEIPLRQADGGGGRDHDLNPFANPEEGFGHYILLNLALGGKNGGPIDPSQLPLRYEIDWVRVYQQPLGK